ncbi:hypothetical protein BO224_07905 [Erysipelotrichaceae bacterium NYU-BL-E8]|uniref:Uncharacterized protein n=1 Tax=Ileibacterium valens TaxID=1862668 RepID=A0A1U7NF00_9FIRM|nr:hypothetical protein BO222_08190 [Ileibacterium valens]OLU39123.1 hypothetical protein BO224_07905 [Erysipelotrichaceae bacterium NYU-BL-E8]
MIHIYHRTLFPYPARYQLPDGTGFFPFAFFAENIMTDDLKKLFPFYCQCPQKYKKPVFWTRSSKPL